jgi:hypothetical protein
MAVQALRAFGDLDATMAADMLPMWRHSYLLSQDDRRAVLEAFPAAPVPAVPAYVEGIQIGGRQWGQAGGAGLPQLASLGAGRAGREQIR